MELNHVYSLVPLSRVLAQTAWPRLQETYSFYNQVTWSKLLTWGAGGRVESSSSVKTAKVLFTHRQSIDILVFIFLIICKIHAWYQGRKLQQVKQKLLTCSQRNVISLVSKQQAICPTPISTSTHACASTHAMQSRQHMHILSSSFRRCDISVFYIWIGSFFYSSDFLLFVLKIILCCIYSFFVIIEFT